MFILRGSARAATRCHIRASTRICGPSTRVRFAHPSTGPSALPVSTLFTVLALLGVSATAYGIYDFYTSFAIWPKELRADLRPGVKAQHQGNLVVSERYLRRAWQTCLTIPRDSLGSEPWLKISGVACKLGEVLEAAESPQEAYRIYAQCLAAMQASGARGELSLPERHRAVALAMHLGELADALGKRKEEEKWLSWSVEEFVRISKTNPAVSRPLGDAEVAELNLPDWTHKDDFEAALEALGSFYAKTGESGYAVRLYMQALSVMLLPTEQSTSMPEASPQKRCRGAQIMTNISSVLLHDNPSPDRLAQAHKWTATGLQLAEKARGELPRPDAECERVWTVLLFNLGAVLEMQNDRQAAKDYFTRSLTHAHRIGMREGIREADDALARLSNVT